MNTCSVNLCYAYMYANDTSTTRAIPDIGMHVAMYAYIAARPGPLLGIRTRMANKHPPPLPCTALPVTIGHAPSAAACRAGPPWPQAPAAASWRRRFKVGNADNT